MSRGPRRSFPADEKGRHTVKAITADDLSGGGALDPQQGIGESGIKPDDEKKLPKPKANEVHEIDVAKMYVPVVKADKDKRIIIGIVLVPEQVDAHGDIYDADVIADAAHDFLASYNDSSTMGLMHNDFKRDIDLLESYLAPMEFTLGDRIVKSGSWIMVVRVNEDKLWEKVKSGKIAGFSIGGKARVKELTDKAE